MAMKAGTRVHTGLRTVTDSSFTSSTGVYKSTSSYSMVTASVDSLSQVVSGKGNYSYPTSQGFERSKNTYLRGDSFVKTKTGTSWTAQTIQGPSVAVTAEAFPTDLLTIADNKALSRLYDQMRNQIDLSVDIAQAGQVKGMVKGFGQLLLYVKRHPAKSLKKFYSDFLRDPKKLGSRWLEFQYGLRPLCQTIYDCGQAAMNDTVQRLKVQGRATEQGRFKEQTFQSQNSVTTRVGLRNARVEYKCKFKLRSGVAQTLSNYTSLNPVSIAWELTPYSFVVDWAVDVGGYLRNLESACLMASLFESGYKTTGMLVTVNQSLSQNYNDSTVEIQKSLSGDHRRSKKSRSVLGGAPFPAVPSFKVDLGVERAANAVALLSQHMGK